MADVFSFNTEVSAGKSTRRDTVRKTLGDVTNIRHMPKFPKLAVADQKPASVPSFVEEIDRRNKNHGTDIWKKGVLALMSEVFPNYEALRKENLSLKNENLSLKNENLSLKNENHQLGNQNKHLAQSNSVMLGILRSEKERVKSLIHEVGLQNHSKVPSLPTITQDTGGESSHPENTNTRHQSKGQSHDELASTDMEKSIKRRRCGTVVRKQPSRRAAGLVLSYKDTRRYRPRSAHEELAW